MADVEATGGESTEGDPVDEPAASASPLAALACAHVL